MRKSLALLSVTAATLLTTTQAYSHVLCAPNNPQMNIGHVHNQAYSVPRIQAVIRHAPRSVTALNHQHEHLQVQRARQRRIIAPQITYHKAPTPVRYHPKTHGHRSYQWKHHW